MIDMNFDSSGGTDGASMQELMLEREHRTIDALLKCKRHGVSSDTLAFLASECGVTLSWNAALKQRMAK